VRAIVKVNEQAKTIILNLLPMLKNLDTGIFFDAVFANARHNAMIVLDPGGKILQSNAAFSLGFGYLPEDVEGKQFDMLFTETDKRLGRPQIELEEAGKTGSKNDENYLISKNGAALWVTGECIAIGDGPRYFVKIIHNINVAKQLERFLEEAEDLIEGIFDSIKDKGLLKLDDNLRVVKVNKAFMQFFDIAEEPLKGVNVGSLHPFWNDQKVKTSLRGILTKNKPLKDNVLEVNSENGTVFRFRLDSKMITDNSLSERRIIVVVQPDESYKLV
jgi:PAS domain S-box-containing protein